MNVKDAQEQLTAILNEIIEIKSVFQAEIPVSDIIISKKDKSGKQLIATGEKLQKLLVTLGLKEERSTQASPSMQPAAIQSFDTEGLLVIACRNIFAEKLDGFKQVYMDSVITGGPLEASFFKALNPSIPETALQNISKKIEKVLKEIETKAKNKHTILMLGVQDEPADELFFKSRNLIEERTKKRVLSISFTSDEEITETEFVGKFKDVA